MKPDFKVLEKVILRQGVPDRVPMYEHFADYEIMAQIMGWQDAPSTLLERWKRYAEFHYEMGYDYMPMEMGPRFPSRANLETDDTALYNRGRRGWVDEHGGPIQTRQDIEEAEWPTPDNAFDYKTFEDMSKVLPEGMKIIGGCSGGPFEHASFLMGLEPLSINLYEDPEMVEMFLNRIGETLVTIAERIAPLDCIGAYRFGDDLGYKTATMISPDHLRKYFLPWSKKVVEVVHKAGKPFVLHSCGNLAQIMDDLIDDVKIDAKHSWEDAIMPVQDAKALWGGRIGILGGVDVDYLCRHTKKECYDYTMRILEACAPSGGYALGTGNTVANYIPVDNYLSMVEACNDFNGR